MKLLMTTLIGFTRAISWIVRSLLIVLKGPLLLACCLAEVVQRIYEYSFARMF